jgi:predicted small lipoprotein YifL
MNLAFLNGLRPLLQRGQRVFASTVLLSLFVSLQACGQKGDLYLPQEVKKEESAKAASTKSERTKSESNKDAVTKEAGAKEISTLVNASDSESKENVENRVSKKKALEPSVTE